MKRKSFWLWSALGVFALSLSGCYTVLKPPFELADRQEEEQLAQRDQDYRNSATDSRIGRFDRYEEDGFYGDNRGYGGSPGFGVGYDSNYGSYGFGSPFGYGYGSPYGSAGPYGYGYDPYNTGGGSGTYIPPGYELITTRELDQLRANNSNLANQPAVNPNLDPVVVKRQQQSREAKAWESRVNSTQRRTPTTTSRPPTADRSSPRAVKSSSDSSAPKPSKASSSSGSSAAKRRSKSR